MVFLCTSIPQQRSYFTFIAHLQRCPGVWLPLECLIEHESLLRALLRRGNSLRCQQALAPNSFRTHGTRNLCGDCAEPSLSYPFSFVIGEPKAHLQLLHLIASVLYSSRLSGRCASIVATNVSKTVPLA